MESVAFDAKVNCDDGDFQSQRILNSKFPNRIRVFHEPLNAEFNNAHSIRQHAEITDTWKLSRRNREYADIWRAISDGTGETG